MRKVTDRTRYLIHITPKQNWPSILRYGLDPNFANSGFKRVWFCTPDRFERFSAHIMRRHNSRLWVDYDLLIVKIRRSRLKRTSWRGVWATPDVVPPMNIINLGSLSLRTLTKAKGFINERA